MLPPPGKKPPETRHSWGVVGVDTAVGVLVISLSCLGLAQGGSLASPFSSEFTVYVEAACQRTGKGGENKKKKTKVKRNDLQLKMQFYRKQKRLVN